MKEHETTPARRPLEPDEVLRVMDAAQVIHERQAALREHGSFDREAAIRDIQVMYEELGDLVDRDVIESALDEYLSQRYAFRSPPRGPQRTLALLYVRRGRIARRVLLPAAGVAALVWAGFTGVEMAERRAEARAAAAQIERAARFGDLQADVDRLHAAVLSAAIEDLALERAAELGRIAEAQVAARDVVGLGETVGLYDDLYGALTSEYRLVITGGVWRQDNRDPRIRNNYLLVEALDPAGRALTLPVRNEETGATERVAAWGERVPRDVYDRVAADKQDNGIVDDNDFGLKRRGFITAERAYPDIGQITRWW